MRAFHGTRGVYRTGVLRRRAAAAAGLRSRLQKRIFHSLVFSGACRILGSQFHSATVISGLLGDGAKDDGHCEILASGVTKYGLGLNQIQWGRIRLDWACSSLDGWNEQNAWRTGKHDDSGRENLQAHQRHSHSAVAPHGTETPGSWFGWWVGWGWGSEG